MGLFRKILFPISLVYGLIVYFRNRFYDWGIFSSKSYQTPVICIGNLSTGGTGKTPMVELLITLLQDKYKVAVLSRGYRRKSQGFVLATNNSSVEELGDEPFQIFSKFKNVQVAVDKNRQNGIALLEKQSKPDVILLDDAFQHRKVKPVFSILLTAFDELYTSDWYLPTGNLRDHKSEAERANVIVVTKCPQNIRQTEFQKIKNKLKAQSHQTVMFSYLKYNSHLLGNGAIQSIEDLKRNKITLVTGIANPKPIIDFLTINQVSFEHMSFKDHHNFSTKEIEVLQKKQHVITTEKDYVRLKNEVTCNYISITHAFFEGNATKEYLENALVNAMKPDS